MSDIVDTAIQAGSFTTLVAAVKAAGLVETLKGTGPFTVFAPTDEAFAKLPSGTVEALLKDVPKLKKIRKNSGRREGKERRERKGTRMGRESLTEKIHCRTRLNTTGLDDTEQISSLPKSFHRTRATTNFTFSDSETKRTFSQIVIRRNRGVIQKIPPLFRLIA